MFRKNRVSAGASRNPSQINANVRIRGTVTVSEPLAMAGQLDGDINADTLHLSSTPSITGEVTDQSVTIDGRVHGTVVADKVFNRQQRILNEKLNVRTCLLLMAHMLTQNSQRGG